MILLQLQNLQKCNQAYKNLKISKNISTNEITSYYIQQL